MNKCFSFIFASFVTTFLVQPCLAETIDRTVAIVNSEVVLFSDVESLESKLGQEGVVDESLLRGKTAKDLKNDRKALIDYLIVEKIIASEIKKQGHTITDDRVQQEFSNIAKRNNISEAQLTQALKSQGLNVDEYRRILKNRIEKQSLLDSEIASKLRISDDEALAEYMKLRPNAKGRINEYSLAHIFFNPKKSGGAEGAVERAQKVLDRLQAGAKFETMAEQFSEDGDFANGGQLGTFKTGELSAEFDDALRSLGVGKHSGLVPSKKGLHILKLVAKKEIPDPAFEKEKESIKSKLLESAFNRQFDSWINQKRDEAFIRINK